MQRFSELHPGMPILRYTIRRKFMAHICTWKRTHSKIVWIVVLFDFTVILKLFLLRRHGIWNFWGKKWSEVMQAKNKTTHKWHNKQHDKVGTRRTRRKRSINNSLSSTICGVYIAMETVLTVWWLVWQRSSSSSSSDTVLTLFTLDYLAERRSHVTKI